MDNSFRLILVVSRHNVAVAENAVKRQLKRGRQPSKIIADVKNSHFRTVADKTVQHIAELVGRLFIECRNFYVCNIVYQPSRYRNYLCFFGNHFNWKKLRNALFVKAFYMQLDLGSLVAVKKGYSS